jgi:hypothetical protein
MTIENCPNCGGTHFGSFKCPYIKEPCSATQEFERLLQAIKAVIDRHCESKEGSGLLYVPVTPREMKELRSAFEPFRNHNKT